MCDPRPAGCAFLPAHLPGAFPYLPGQSGCNKRLRAALPLLQRAIRALARDTDLWTDGQLDLELHSGRSPMGVAVRVAQRILALTAAIWHNRATSQPVTRSSIAYDH